MIRATLALLTVLFVTGAASPASAPTPFPMGDRLPAVTCNVDGQPCVVGWTWNGDGTLTVTISHHGATITSTPIPTASLTFLAGSSSRKFAITTNFGAGTVSITTP